MNFLQIKEQRPVNLDNVSTIFVDTDKVIFHFNNARTLKSGVNVPDYLYWNIESNEAKVYEELIRDKLNESWLIPNLSDHRYINLENTSSIGYDEKKLKVIFNFNFSISHPHYSESLIAAYEFWEFGNNERLFNVVKDLLNKTGEE